jgi:hypothetical protein
MFLFELCFGTKRTSIRENTDELHKKIDTMAKRIPEILGLLDTNMTKTITSSIDKTTNEIQKLTLNSRNKGNFTEIAILNFIQSRFSDHTINRLDVGGDMVIDSSILIEVKNYAKSVPKQEIDKFESDSEPYKVSIFISIGVISRKKDRINIETINGRYLIYLSNSYEELVEAAITLSFQLTKEKIPINKLEQECRILKEKLASIQLRMREFHELSLNANKLYGEICSSNI